MLVGTVLPILLKIENPLSVKHVQGAIQCRAGTLELGEKKKHP